MEPTPPTDIKIPPIATGSAVLTYATPEKMAIPIGWTNAETHLLAPEKRTSYLLTVALINIIATLIFSGIALAFMMYGLHKSEWLFAILFLVIFGSMQTVAFTRTIFRVKKQWATYRLIIADQGFIQMAAGFPTVRVEVAEVQRFVDTWDVLRVYISKNRFVAIPKRIEHWPTLKARLAAWQKTEFTKTKRRLILNLAFVWAISLGSMTLFFWGEYSNDGRVILSCAGGVVIILLIRLWFLFRQKGIPARTWIAFIVSALLPLVLLLRWLSLTLGII